MLPNRRALHRTLAAIVLILSAECNISVAGYVHHCKIELISVWPILPLPASLGLILGDRHVGRGSTSSSPPYAPWHDLVLQGRSREMPEFQGYVVSGTRSQVRKAKDEIAKCASLSCSRD